MNASLVDIQETEILAISPELLATLLKDHTTGGNIFWATDDYAALGAGYQYNDPITIESITGDNGAVIVPRALKSRQQQQQRSRDMAEVFTPSWICNKQNNLVDNAWFGRENVFNTEVDGFNGSHTWVPAEGKIEFPEGKSWRDYVIENRLEITCGEAPYIASRYDTVTGESIPVERRMGFLDRKLRIVGENTQSADEWIEWAQKAFQGSYGFEWQGDNIILARESLLYTFIDYYRMRFGKDPHLDLLLVIADIISWNIWQMDGLKGVIPNSCIKVPKLKKEPLSLFTSEEMGEREEPTLFDCPGCKNKNFHTHTGKYAIIKDWQEDEELTFVSLIKQK